MKKNLIALNLLLLLLLFTSGIMANDSQVNTIVIPQQVQVTRLKVRLQEIAQIKGSKSFKEQIKNIDLGQAPLPDYKRTIYRQEVISVLRNKQIDLSQVVLQVPYQFNVISNYRKLPVKRLIETGKNYIYNQLPYSSNNIKIRAINPPQKLRVPTGNLEIEVESTFSRHLVGRTMIPVRILVDNQLYKRFYLQYEVKLWKKVLVAKENLKQDQTIKRSLFKEKRKLVTNPNQEFVTLDDSLTNMQLKNSLRAGRPLLKHMIEMPSLVKRWQDVMIIAQIGGVRISTIGRSLEPGHKGEIIKVKNKSSGKSLKGKVVAKGQVKVIIR
ncbi:hypothetical protein JCM16358_13530 [Halanaerocella petrolearia]